MTAEQLHSLLKELLARLDHPLAQMRPVEASLKDPLPRESRTKQYGVVRKLSCDIDQDFYQWLMVDIPENAVLKCIIWLEEQEPQTEAAPTFPAVKKLSKTKIPDGPHGKFWQEMFLEGVIGRSDFQQLTGIQPGLDNWHETIRGIFETPSLTHISPDQLMVWLNERDKALAVKGGFEDVTDLLKKIQSVIDSLEPEFPEGQYISPFAMGAKKQPEQTDEQFLAENLMP